ncbi:MAG: 50S ribosomal protein L33 [Candidatus Hydrogenedentes bacterium]|nr:50S ribosomal protein L33 [Candidatus Hydrogenedentota bacterium]
MANKIGRERIILQSTESPFRYSTTRNTRTKSGRLLLKKYDPIVRKHVLFKEHR